jgi:hypothetical protein
MAKSILLGLAAVFATAVLSIVAEVIVFFVHLSPSPGAEVGVDLLILAKQKLCTPTGFIAAAVIFALAVLLSIRRGTR